MADRGDLVGTAVRILIAVLCAAAMLLIVVILSGAKLDDTSGKAIATAVAFALFALTGMAGYGLRERAPAVSLFGYAVAIVSAVAFVLGTSALWTDGETPGWKLVAVLLTLALGGGHASLLLGGEQESDSQAVRLTRAGVLGTIAVLCLMIVSDIAEHGHRDPRAYGAIAVLYLLGAIVLPLVRRASPVEPSAAGRVGTAQPVSAAPPVGTAQPVDAERPAAPTGSRSAVEILEANGMTVVDGPSGRTGTYGAGEGTCLRTPDGRLVELITYESGI